MESIKTPDGIIAELVEIRKQAARGVEIQEEVEREYVAALLAAERAEAAAFLEATGTEKLRQAVAKIKSEPERMAAELAKVKLNRVKTKLKQLSEAQMSVQTQARMVELTYRTAGVGER
jgi:hypothetical protein